MHAQTPGYSGHTPNTGSCSGAAPRPLDGAVEPLPSRGPVTWEPTASHPRLSGCRPLQQSRIPGDIKQIRHLWSTRHTWCRPERGPQGGCGWGPVTAGAAPGPCRTGPQHCPWLGIVLRGSSWVEVGDELRAPSGALWGTSEPSCYSQGPIVGSSAPPRKASPPSAESFRALVHPQEGL